jgi:hypothetical protein
MSNWQPIETAPKDRPFLAKEGEDIYKCRYSWHCDDTNFTYYESFCGQPICQPPEPEKWCEIP